MAANGYEQFDDSAFEPQADYGFAECQGDMSMSISVGNSSDDRATNHAIFDNTYESNHQRQQLGAQANVASSTLHNASELNLSGNTVCVLSKPFGNIQFDAAIERFGQITPPDDEEVFAYDKPPGNTHLSTSERARNAANQRHSKKARKDSKQDASEQSDNGVASGSDKKEKYREKNRQAAAKCRDKKKKNTEQLDKKYKIIAAENAARRLEFRKLRGEFCAWRELALQHAPEHCSCGPLHDFNMQQVVKEASNMARSMSAGLTRDSLSIGSLPPGVPSPSSMAENITRADSDFGSRDIAKRSPAHGGEVHGL